MPSLRVTALPREVLTCLLCLCPQIHIIDFDDENNLINKNVLLHQVGEIWHISASPADRGVLATCYSKSEYPPFVPAATGGALGGGGVAVVSLVDWGVIHRICGR